MLGFILLGQRDILGDGLTVKVSSRKWDNSCCFILLGYQIDYKICMNQVKDSFPLIQMIEKMCYFCDNSGFICNRHWVSYVFDYTGSDAL